MVVSIVLTDKHKIELDTYGRFEFKGKKINIKNIPFVRYRFQEYGTEEYEYIENMRSIFIYSSHMAEIRLDENTKQVLNDLDDMESLIQFVYIDVTNKELVNGFSSKKEQLIRGLRNEFIDRLMLKDNTTELDTVSATRIRTKLSKDTGMDMEDIGICQSPLSFSGGMACLTAVKARELSAEYAENDEVALPTANHENMSRCGCIKYITIKENLKAPKSKRKTKSKKGRSRKRKKKGLIRW